jgi:hypothetical protein
MAGKKLRELGWGPMMDALVWKAPTTKAVKKSKEGEDEFYDGNGNLIPSISSGTSTGSGGLKKVVVGYDTLSRYPDDPSNLANLLSGLSSFAPEGLTDIYDVNGNLLFEALIYDSVLDLANAMLRSESYRSMYYITHYFYIDKTYKTPRVFGKNLAYWTLVGRPNYSNKKEGYPISTYFQALNAMGTGQSQVNAHTALCQQIALYLMNNVPAYQLSEFTWEEISMCTFPSRYETYFNWPNFYVPFEGPVYAKTLYNSSNGIFEVGEKKKERAEGEVDVNILLGEIYQKNDTFQMRNSSWQVNTVHKIDFTFDNEMKECSYMGRQVWKSPNFPERGGNITKRVWKINEEAKDISKSKRRSIKEHPEKNQHEYWASSSIMLFEMTNKYQFLGNDPGTYRYFMIKPFSEDFYSVQYGTDPYDTEFLYILIEEAGKNPTLQKVNLSKLEWPHLFDSEGFDVAKGWSGNFNLFSLPISDWTPKFAKYLKGTVTNDDSFSIKFMLQKIQDEKGLHGYFIEHSDKYLSIEKTKIRGINQIRIKNIGS